MDKSTIIKKIESIFNKHKYTLLILVIGLVLMLIPGKNKTDSELQPAPIDMPDTVSIEERLSSLLSNIDKAGRVQVLLTESTGAETLYQVNEERTTQNDSCSVKITTVIVTDSQRSESGLIRQINPPSYLGAVILCQGADNISVKYAIVEAICKATGLGADKVSVLKMK